MKIKVINEKKEVIFELNESKASLSLYKQLPLEVNVENYADNEKIFYLSHHLDTQDTPLLQNGNEGTLAYFEPWNNVVMYYGQCGAYSGLYVLGEAISGSDLIKTINGMIRIERVK